MRCSIAAWLRRRRIGESAEALLVYLDQVVHTRLDGTGHHREFVRRHRRADQRDGRYAVHGRVNGCRIVQVADNRLGAQRRPAGDRVAVADQDPHRPCLFGQQAGGLGPDLAGCCHEDHPCS
jgi:hypothetical protein